MKTLKTVETFRKEASIEDARTDDPERVFHADRKRRRRGCRAGAAARARQAVQQEGEGGGATQVATPEAEAAGRGISPRKQRQADLIFSTGAGACKPAVPSQQDGAQGGAGTVDPRYSQVATVAVTWSDHRRMEGELRALQEEVERMRGEAEKERAQQAKELKRAQAQAQHEKARKVQMMIRIEGLEEQLESRGGQLCPG